MYQALHSRCLGDRAALDVNTTTDWKCRITLCRLIPVLRFHIHIGVTGAPQVTGNAASCCNSNVCTAVPHGHGGRGGAPAAATGRRQHLLERDLRAGDRDQWGVLHGRPPAVLVALRAAMRRAAKAAPSLLEQVRYEAWALWRRVRLMNIGVGGAMAELT